MNRPVFLDQLMEHQQKVVEDNEGFVECDCCGKLRPEEEVHEFYDVKLNPYLKCQWCLEEDWG